MLARYKRRMTRKLTPREIDELRRKAAQQYWRRLGERVERQFSPVEA